MSQLAASEGQPRCSGGGAGFLLRRPETERFQAEGWQEPCESRGSRTVVCPDKVGMFSRSQSCQGNKQKPCSLDGRYEENRLSEAHRQSCLGIVSESPGRNESERTGGPESENPRRPSPQP